MAEKKGMAAGHTCLWWVCVCRGDIPTTLPSLHLLPTDFLMPCCMPAWCFLPPLLHAPLPHTPAPHTLQKELTWEGKLWRQACHRLHCWGDMPATCMPA